MRWTTLLLSTALATTTLSAQADERLALAAMERDLDTVRQLLSEQYGDVDALGPHGTPALHWLVRIEDLALTERLLQQGADADLPTSLGLRALNVAISNHDESMVALLLSYGADPNLPDWTGETPLMQAAREGAADIVAQLLEAGAQVEAKEPHHEQSALMMGVRSGNAAVVERLISAGADVNAQSRAGPVPDFILPSQSSGSRGVGVNRGGWPDRGIRMPVGGAKTPLLYATRQGDLDSVKHLVEAGADLEQADANGITPLLNAILNATVATEHPEGTGHVAVAHYLMAQGANINAQDWYGQTPLWAAVELRNLAVSGATRNNRIDREAAFELIVSLLDQGAEPNVRIREFPPEHRWVTRLGSLSWVDFTGETPFLRAALAGDVRSMQLLVEHGADPAITTFEGTTPLMAAAGVNWVVNQTFDEGEEALLEAVKLAHALGNDLHATNTMGLSAVHGAANRGSNQILRWLAEQGADLEQPDAEGRTPFVWAQGVFLATHPPVEKPETMALIESLIEQRQKQAVSAVAQQRSAASLENSNTPQHKPRGD